MPFRLAWLLALPMAVVTLAACDGGSTTPGHGTTRTTTAPTFPLSTAANIDCPKFDGIGQRIAEAQTKLFTPGAGADAAMRSLRDDLTALKADAPADVDAAIDDSIAGFQSLASLVTASPPPSDAADRLSKLGPRLAADSQKINAYITTACK